MKMSYRFNIIRGHLAENLTSFSMCVILFIFRIYLHRFVKDVSSMTFLYFRPDGRHVHRGQGVRQLRLRVHAAVAPGRHRTLPVQRLRPLPQDERHQQATHQATEAPGKTHESSNVKRVG